MVLTILRSARDKHRVRVLLGVVPVGAALVLLDPVQPIPLTITAGNMTLVVVDLASDRLSRQQGTADGCRPSTYFREATSRTDRWQHSPRAALRVSLAVRHTAAAPMCGSG
jgi:hypothetical protein